MLNDRALTCSSCQLTFLDTAQAQRERARLGVSAPPQECPGCLALERLTRRHRGVVRWYDRWRGYGFIRDERGVDVFVHRSALVSPSSGRLRAGAPVEFALGQGERGLVARCVALADRKS